MACCRQPAVEGVAVDDVIDGNSGANRESLPRREVEGFGERRVVASRSSCRPRRAAGAAQCRRLRRPGRSRRARWRRRRRARRGRASNGVLAEMVTAPFGVENAREARARGDPHPAVRADRRVRRASAGSVAVATRVPSGAKEIASRPCWRTARSRGSRRQAPRRSRLDAASTGRTWTEAGRRAATGSAPTSAHCGGQRSETAVGHGAAAYWSTPSSELRMPDRWTDNRSPPTRRPRRRRRWRSPA